MIVADLIAALRGCDPDAIVLIPCDQGAGGEPLTDVVAVPAAAFSSGPTAIHGAVRLAGLPTMSLVVVARGVAPPGG